MERSSFCPASHWGEKKYPRTAPGRGVLQKDSGEGGTEVSGFQKPLPGELEVAMKDLWKPKGEVFLPCPCSLYPAPSASGGLGAIPKDTREIQSPGSWGRAELGSHHMTGEFHFRDNKSRLFPSAEVPSLEGFEAQTPNPAADCGSGSPRIKPGELQWGSPRAAEPELPGASIAAFPRYQLILKSIPRLLIQEGNTDWRGSLVNSSPSG